MTETTEELARRLTPLQFEVTQHGGTEPAFTGIYVDNHEDGAYHCIVCDAPLFDSATKYDSGSGWPSFTAAVDADRVTLLTDTSHGMVRTEVRCTGQRYCMNSASLDFRPGGTPHP